MIELELASAQHRIFVLRLELLVEQIEEADYDHVVVGDDEACALGRWMNGSGRALAYLPQCADLREAHRRFHEQAGEMVRRFNGGDVAGAAAVLSGSFAQASRAVDAAIERLRDVARAEREELDTMGIPRVRRQAPGMDPDLLTGIPMIDAQHKEIAEIARGLLDHPHGHVDAPVVLDTLRELGMLIALHFDSEELFMKHAGVLPADIADHQREHAELLRRYEGVALQAGAHNADGPCDVCLAVDQWMADHVRRYDLMLKAYAHVAYP
jgi:hemerythrin-like metal-binding protein